jgi:hypothetical protein
VWVSAPNELKNFHPCPLLSMEFDVEKNKIERLCMLRNC